MSKNWRNNVFVITGQIASGKSLATSFFKSLGAFTVSADELAREVVDPKGNEILEIKEKLGHQFIDENNQLKRKLLAKEIFSNKEKREILNSIIHPKIELLASSLFTSKEARKAPLRLYEVPLFFELEMQNHGYKGSILIISDTKDIIERAKKRDNLKKEEILLRLNSQLPTSQKITKATYIIKNTKDIPHLKRRLKTLYKTLT